MLFKINYIHLHVAFYYRKLNINILYKLIMLKKIVLLAFLCFPFGMFAQDLKIARVNTMEIFNVMPETTAAETELANFNQSLQTELQRMEEEYNRKYTEFMQQSDTLVENIKVRRMQEIHGLREKIENFYQESQQNIVKKREELNAPIIQRIQSAIKSVGEEQAYTYIMEIGAFLYISPKSIDATPQVKAKLGLK